jgi:hypothetical protein
VPPILRLLKLGLAAVGGLILVWFEGVRRAPEVRRRKALRRR